MLIDFRTSGGIDSITLKKTDGKRYSAEEIARRDSIDMPFENDDDVLGKWKAVSFIDKKEDFSPDDMQDGLYFSEIEFFEGGRCKSVYGEETITERQVWTKGYVLRKWNNTACAYELRCGGKYLIIEWKSGDYRWGGYDTDYYVFMRI